MLLQSSFHVLIPPCSMENSRWHVQCDLLATETREFGGTGAFSSPTYAHWSIGWAGAGDPGKIESTVHTCDLWSSLRLDELPGALPDPYHLLRHPTLLRIRLTFFSLALKIRIILYADRSVTIFKLPWRYAIATVTYQSAEYLCIGEVAIQYAVSSRSIKLHSEACTACFKYLILSLTQRILSEAGETLPLVTRASSGAKPSTCFASFCRKDSGMRQGK